MKTGNVKQVAAFGKLVGICNDLGAGYNPSKEALQLNAITSLFTQAQQSLEAMRVARTNYLLAVNARQENFAGVYTRSSRVVRALISSEGSEENIRDARLLKRKLHPRPLAKISHEPAAGQEGSVAPVSKTSSRLDFESMADTFAELVSLVQSIPAYSPNETELKVTTLRSMLTGLRDQSKTVADATRALATARIHRNNTIAGKDGLFQTANAVKEYIRSVYGVRSEQARELGKLRSAA
jgi:hypothetical protein